MSNTETDKPQKTSVEEPSLERRQRWGEADSPMHEIKKGLDRGKGKFSKPE